MALYVIRRLVQALLVVFITSVIIFIVLHLLPGDPIYMYMSQSQFESASAEQIEAIRQQYGLDQPIIAQYFTWLGDLLHGDLGRSIIKSQPVNTLLAQALPVSLYLGVLAFIVSNIFGVLIGIVCAVRRGKWQDTLFTILANIGITAPIFWAGILLIYAFSMKLGWLPTHGYTPPLDDFVKSTRQIILPVICLSMFPLSGAVRQTRSAMLEVIGQDYMRTARAKGLSERAVVFGHGLKNGILPVVTLAGMQVGPLIGGEVLVETVFGIPGVGQLSVNALLSRDYAIVQGIVLVVSIVVVLCNLLVDISYKWLNPKVSFD